jgi:hypothetical protein
MAQIGQAHQRPIQQDWANREYIEVITGSIKKISDFLNSFGRIFCHHIKYNYDIIIHKCPDSCRHGHAQLIIHMY